MISAVQWTVILALSATAVASDVATIGSDEGSWWLELLRLPSHAMAVGFAIWVLWRRQIESRQVAEDDKARRAEHDALVRDALAAVRAEGDANRASVKDLADAVRRNADTFAGKPCMWRDTLK